ncbi:MAG: hypothetical protein OHK0047_25370 [Leptolyngbyaceae cyanobacterium]
MNNLISGAIARIASLVKFFRLKQALIVVFAGLILLTSTACAGSSMASETGVNSGSSPYDKSTGLQRELYAPTQQRQGGMNLYNDDVKYDRDVNKAQTDKTIHRSSQHLEKQAANPKEMIDNLNDRDIPGQLGDVARNLGNRAQQMKDEVSAGTQRGMRNLKQNLNDAKEAVPEVVNQAID